MLSRHPLFFNKRSGTAIRSPQVTQYSVPGIPKKPFRIVFPDLTTHYQVDWLLLLPGCLLPRDSPSPNLTVRDYRRLCSADAAEKRILTAWIIALLRAFIVSTGLENVFTVV